MDKFTLFNFTINGWQSWGKVFQSIESFTPLIHYIFRRESLPVSNIENLTPGSNAVFKVGGYVIKIYAPIESGLDTKPDYDTELFGIGYAHKSGVAAPKIIAAGEIRDRYLFRYLIIEYINGSSFGDIMESLTDDDKIDFGKRLRMITDKLNRPVGNAFGLRSIDIIDTAVHNKRWDIFPAPFNNERLEYLKQMKTSEMFNGNVFVHGDLNADNIILSGDGEIYLIDFADSLSAPIIYEKVVIIAELFQFDKSFLRGYLGNYDVDCMVKLCLDGLMIHDFGAGIINARVSAAAEIDSLDTLKRKLETAMINCFLEA
jgi:fructosamine-3-kinase